MHDTIEELLKNYSMQVHETGIVSMARTSITKFSCNPDVFKSALLKKSTRLLQWVVFLDA